MLKKIGFVTAGVAAGMVMLSGFASAEGSDYPGWGHDHEGGDQTGLVNLNNLEGEWTIEDSNIPYVQKDSSTVQFAVSVQENSAKALRFTIVTYHP